MAREAADAKKDIETGGNDAQIVDIPTGKNLKDRHRFNVEIDPAHTSSLLVVCYFISGLVDSTVYDAWGCFVSMQTGNTIFVALGASHPPGAKPYGWAKSLISICCFLLGSVFFSRAFRRFGPLRRTTLTAVFGLQTCLIFIAAVMVQVDVVSGTPETYSAPMKWMEVIPLALLSFQSAGQIVTSRLLGLNELPTVVLTSLYCDLVSDPQIFAPLMQNKKRNRRICGQVALLIGAISGGWISISSAGMSAVLWISGLLKLVVTISWVVWKAKA